MAPKIHYHRNEKILSLSFRNAKSVESDIEGNVVIDYDRQGKVVRVEIMHFNLDDFVPVRQFHQLAVRAR